MKLNTLKYLLIFGTLSVLSTVDAEDIFAPTPIAKESNPLPYPTSTAFLSATKNGEIPELLLGRDTPPRRLDALGRSIVAVLQHDYGVAARVRRHSLPLECQLLLQNLTKYEVNPEGDAARDGTRISFDKQAFQRNRQSISTDPMNEPKLIEALDSFAKDYARAVRAYLASKMENEKKRQAEANEKDRQAKIEDENQKALADAKAASEQSAQDTKNAAAEEARKVARAEREKKLQEVLHSPAYRLWETSLKIEQGEQMIKSAQATLDHDDEVKRESGVSDLALRRTAGEDLVAGKHLVEGEFPNYKQLGGTAATPEQVHAGTDPSEECR